MPVILATAGSNSTTSINFKLIQYAVSLLPHSDTECIELAKHQFPMYGEDLERSEGIPESIGNLRKQLQQAKGLILSVNEHNGNPSAFFKNILDWLSRDERRFLEGTSVLLMSTSGGKRGAISSRTVVEEMLKRFGAEVVATFSLSGFHTNFNPEGGITDPAQESLLREALEVFSASIAE